MTGAPKRRSWLSIRARLKQRGAPELIGLIHDVYVRLPEARAVIGARVFPDAPDRAALAVYRRKIESAMRWSFLGPRSPDMGLARKIARDYKRASDDAAGALELILLAVELGIGYHAELGDDMVVDSLHRAMHEVERLAVLPGAKHVRGMTAERLRVIGSDPLGYGLSDHLLDAAAALDAHGAPKGAT